MLNRDRKQIEGQPCWEVLRLRSPEGKLMCRSQCAVQTQARGGKLERTRPAVLTLNGDAPQEVNLLAVAVSPPAGRRIAILHVLEMSPKARTASVDEEGCVSKLAEHACLSPRERQVLRHLASGKKTEQIAGDLFVSRATVRNHVRAILTKLNVHSRIEAILAVVAGR